MEGTDLLLCRRCTLPDDLLDELLVEQRKKFYNERLKVDDEYETEIGWQYD